MLISAVCVAELSAGALAGPDRNRPFLPIAQRRAVAEAPRGRVRLEGRVLRDDDGPFLGLGASLFWGVWGYSHDRTRLVQQFELLRSHGFEFVRVLGVVAGPGWEDRTADPQDPQFDASIAGMTDLAFEHGLRVAWTIFGNTFAARTPAARLKIVDRFAAMAKGREQKIVFVEIANEGWQNGFGNRLEELQDLGRQLKTKTSVLVTTTSPPLPLRCGPALTSIYGPGAADFITLHFDRNIAMPEGRWGPVRQTMAWPAVLAPCREKLPGAAANTEPIGPQSSVASEEDPLHILAAAAVTYTAGLPIYVLHSGPGVRGGGRADRERGRAASLSELPRGDELLGGLAALKEYLPPDLPGWDRFDVTMSGGPVQIQPSGTGVKLDVAAAHRGGQFVVVAFAIRDPLVLQASVSLQLEVLQPVTGARTLQHTMARGDRVRLPSGLEAVVIIGRVR